MQSGSDSAETTSKLEFGISDLEFIFEDSHKFAICNFPPLLVFQKVACTISNLGYNKMATFWSPTTEAADKEAV